MAGRPGRSGGDRKSQKGNTKADAGPKMPVGQAKAFVAKWKELLSQLPAPALRSIDVHQLQVLTRLLCHENDLAGMLDRDPADLKVRRLYLNTAQSIDRLSARFGLSPSDRQRLKLEEEPEGDAADEWENG
jgi:hypothetical protein